MPVGIAQILEKYGLIGSILLWPNWDSLHLDMSKFSVTIKNNVKS